MLDAAVESSLDPVVRTHPWSASVDDPAARYVDFRRHPHLIRTTLEDFAPLSAEPAVQRFYEMLEWLNGPSSHLESNDCGLAPFRRNRLAGVKYPRVTYGRLMVLARDLRLNVCERTVRRMVERLSEELAMIDRGFRAGAVAVSRVPTLFLELPARTRQDRLGHLLHIRFWAFGRDDQGTLRSLDRVVANIWSALRKLSRAVQRGMVSGRDGRSSTSARPSRRDGRSR